MAKNCTEKNPTIRIRVHTPKQLLHGHNDKTLEIKGETDFEAWTKATRAMLEAFGYVNARLQIGFFWDLINQFPREVRAAIIAGIAQGLSLDVKETTNKAGEVIAQISEVQKYEPLVKTKRSDGLFLPGDKDFSTPK